jgi:opacity protein-like surface antigen
VWLCSSEKDELNPNRLSSPATAPRFFSEEHSMRKAVTLIVGIILLLSLSGFAQENRSEISLQAMGLFTRDTTGNGNSYSATESGGFLGTYRYHVNHWLSAEAAYGYSLDTQKYDSAGAFRIQSRIHQLTGAMIFNLPSRPSSRISPYAIAGAGALLFSPTGNQLDSLSGAQLQAKPAFVYGLGLNYAIRKHISLRAEYRGFLYSTPDFGFGGLATNTLTHTAMPSVGLTFRF